MLEKARDHDSVFAIRAEAERAGSEIQCHLLLLANYGLDGVGYPEFDVVAIIGGKVQCLPTSVRSEPALGVGRVMWTTFLLRRESVPSDALAIASNCTVPVVVWRQTRGADLCPPLPALQAPAEGLPSLRLACTLAPGRKS
jgi:hypothetical protein